VVEIKKKNQNEFLRDEIGGRTMATEEQVRQKCSEYGTEDV